MPDRTLFDARMPCDEDAEHDDQQGVEACPNRAAAVREGPDHATGGGEKHDQARSRDLQRTFQLSIATGCVVGGARVIPNDQAAAFRAWMFSRQ